LPFHHRYKMGLEILLQYLLIFHKKMEHSSFYITPFGL
jgi:hypothetical protein